MNVNNIICFRMKRAFNFIPILLIVSLLASPFWLMGQTNSINLKTGTFTIGPKGIVNAETLSTGSSDTLFTIQSDETGTGSLFADRTATSFPLHVERYLSSSNWHIISSPVSGQELGEFVLSNSIVKNTQANDYDLAPYNEQSNGWSPYTVETNTNIMPTGTSYSVRKTNTGTVTFSGNIYIDDLSLNLRLENAGWNAIGNPFTSALKIRGENSFLETNSTSLDDNYLGVYVWDQSKNGSGDYVIIAGAELPFFEDTISQNQIAVAQGFIVRAASDNASVAINKTMRTVNPTIPFKSAKISWPGIRLKLKKQNLQSTTIIAFNEQMTPGSDPSYDLGILKSNPNISVYTQLLENNGIDFAIQALPLDLEENYRIPIGIDLPMGGEISISIESLHLPNDFSMVLEDTKTGSLTSLVNSNDAYTTYFYPEEQKYGRFYLLAGNVKTSVETQTSREKLWVYEKEKIIYIKGEMRGNSIISVYSSDGKLWEMKEGNDVNSDRINARHFPSGIYFVHIQNQGKTEIRKIPLL